MSRAGGGVSPGIAVTDVDRAKSFYTEQLGFALDVDHRGGDTLRVVQLTPAGSACSITIGTINGVARQPIRNAGTQMG